MLDSYHIHYNSDSPMAFLVCPQYHTVDLILTLTHFSLLPPLPCCKDKLNQQKSVYCFYSRMKHRIDFYDPLTSSIQNRLNFYTLGIREQWLVPDIRSSAGRMFMIIKPSHPLPLKWDQNAFNFGSLSYKIILVHLRTCMGLGVRASPCRRTALGGGVSDHFWCFRFCTGPVWNTGIQSEKRKR